MLVSRLIDTVQRLLLRSSKVDRTRGDAARDRRDWAAAADAYRRYLRKRPFHGAVWLRLGNMLKEQGSTVEADHAYARAAMLLPASGRASAMRGELRYDAGDWRAATTFYLEAWRRDHDFQAGLRLARPEMAVHLAQQQSSTPGERITGAIEGVRDFTLRGWAWNPDRPDVPVALTITVNGIVAGQIVADEARPDLVELGLSATALCGFSFNMTRYIGGQDIVDVAVRPICGSAVIAASPLRLRGMVGIGNWLGRAVNTPAPPGPVAITIITPVHDVSTDWFAELAASVLQQDDGCWQWVLVDDGSTCEALKEQMLRTVALDARIRLISNPISGGTAAAINAGLRVAEGDYILFLDHDDRLEPEAIGLMRKAAASGADLIYGDEIVAGRDLDEIRLVVARPAYSWRYYLSHPYFVHPVCVKRDLAIINWDETLQASSDVDFVLRVLENAVSVVHQPGILYRWRTHEKSSGHALERKVTEATVSAINRHLARLGKTMTVKAGVRFNTYRLDTEDPGGRVLIVIPTKNRADLIRQCLASILETCPIEDIDIVIIDHDSDEPELQTLLSGFGDGLKVMSYTGPFNYSKMNNQAISMYGGNHRFVLFLNNDVEALDRGWLERLRGLAGQDDVGAVGPILIYPDGRVQHAGVIIGPGGYAEHAMKFEPLFIGGRRNPGYNCSLVAVRDWSAVTGACLMMRLDVFREVGGFDETLPVGFNDTDLCLRVRDRGFNVIVDGWSVLMHHESLTRSAQGEVRHPEDSDRFAAKWREQISAGDPFYSPLLSLERDHQPEHPDTASLHPRITQTRRQ